MARSLLLIAVCIPLLLAGCGQKGDLYLPDKDKASQEESQG